MLLSRKKLAIGTLIGTISLMPACSQAALQVFPDDVANPTTPVVAPSEGGASGKALSIAATFTYPIDSSLDFHNGGEVSVALRGGGERQAQTLLSFRDGERTLTLITEGVEKNRALALSWKDGEKAVKSVSSGVALSDKWETVSLKWDDSKVTLRVGGKEISLAKVGAFAPSRVSVLTSRVDELNLKGRGQFQLGWENGYAATLVPADSSREIAIRPQGFDAFFVSNQLGRRDTPSLQLLNSSPEAFTGTVRFSMTSENGKQKLEWTQIVQVQGRSSALVPIQFSQPLTPDVYHLRIQCSAGTLNFDENRHFLFAGTRDDKAGPAKFGFHDSNRDTFGFWPDAIPVDLAHHYVRWGYVVGPSWIKDSMGKYGIDPDTPSDEWFWNTRLDWSVQQGLMPYVCIGGEPMLDWMREKKYAPERMKKNDWGEIGGKPNLTRYRQFVRVLANRYKGKVRAYEIQNEPNSYPPGGWEPSDYVDILRVAFEEIHAADPQAKVYGISGTGDFVPWMTKVFELGGAKYMDGVSFHTYTTPKLPDADLPAKLQQVRALIQKHNPALTLFNSETGTYVAPREEVGQMIPPARLTELIQKGESPTLTVSKGWPNYALDELTGSLSIVRNATYNLAAGAERFVFFGWNPKWPNADWWTKREYGGWGMISATRDAKERTPNLYALAVGVCAVQLESVVPNSATPIEQANVRGAVFRTAGGGSTAVVWSTSGARTAIFDVKGQGIDAVSLFGQPVALKSSANTASLELTEQPLYLHLKEGTLNIQPSPVNDVKLLRNPDGHYTVSYTITNRGQSQWQGNVDYQVPAGWKVEPMRSNFTLASGQKTKMSIAVTPPPKSNGTRIIIAKLTTSDGGTLTASLPVKVRPTLDIPFVAKNGPLDFDAIPTSPLALNRPEQVVIGRPPALSSLQETKYWQGPDELSAQVKTAYSSTGLSVAVRVHDANFRVPSPWPAVTGSAIELFVDLRSQENGLGTSRYTKGVYQFILKPPATQGDVVQIWTAKGADGEISGLQASGTRIGDKDYEVNFFLPWNTVGLTPAAGLQLGLDVAVDGATATSTGRKTQMALVGTVSNTSDASEFGHAVLGQQ